MDTLGLGQPLLVVLVKFALLYALIQLDIVSFPQNSQHIVVHLSHTLIRVLNQLQNPHQHFAFIEDTLESHSVEDVAVDGVQGLAYELWVVLLAEEESEDGFEQLYR